MSFLHVFQQVLDIRVLFLTEAAVLLQLHMDTLYMDLHPQRHKLQTMQLHTENIFSISNTVKREL